MRQLPFLVNYKSKSGVEQSCYLGRHGLYDNEREERSYGGYFNLETIQEARVWIRKNIVKTPSIDYRNDSFGLKNDCRIDTRRDIVSNGEFIYAMILEGYRVSRLIGASSCYFNARKATRVMKLRRRRII